MGKRSPHEATCPRIASGIRQGRAMSAINPISPDKLQISPDPCDREADLSMTPVASMKTPPDVVCLYGARALRGFGDGFAIIIFPVYLSAIGFSPQQIGIVASASLLGTAALTLITGFIAPRHQLRSLFFAGAGLIVSTGLVFPAAETIALVLLVAFVGSINPSGGDLGMLVPLEHAL